MLCVKKNIISLCATSSPSDDVGLSYKTRDIKSARYPHSSKKVGLNYFVVAMEVGRKAGVREPSISRLPERFQGARSDDLCGTWLVLTHIICKYS
jgi:hypothetical protein